MDGFDAKRQDAEIASVVCVKSGANARSRARMGLRLFLAAALMSTVAWGVGGVAGAQAADPAQAEAPPAAAETAPTPEAPAAPAETAPTPEAPATGAVPTAPETEADEQPEAAPEPKVEAEPPSSAAGTEGQVAGETESEPEETQPAAGRWIRGSFDAGFDGTWSDGGSDIDFDQTLRLRLDPPQYPRLHVRGAVRLEEDLDSDDYYESELRDFDDTTDSDVRANLLHLYVDIDDLWGDSVLRLGRQRIAESPLYNRVDGLYFKQRLPGWEWYVFGGARASNYYDTHEDAVLGAGVAVQVTPVTRVALDAFYGDEDRDEDIRVRPLYRLFDLQFPRRVEENIDNNYVSLSVWQWFTPNISFFGRLGVQDGNLDDLVLSVNGQYEPWDVSYEATYRGQLDENGDQVNDLTSYYRILGEYEEYNDLLVAVHKPLNEVYTVSLEGQWHNSSAGGDETWANRDFQRYALILSADELVPTVDASVALEYWDVDQGESTWAVTGEVSKTWERLELILGADYERYEDRVIEYNPWVFIGSQGLSALAPFVGLPPLGPGYNPIVYLFDTRAVEMHENIYSLYGKVEYELAEDQELALKVTFEEDDGPESPYWRVQAGYTINF